jgi:hypothetical protein
MWLIFIDILRDRILCRNLSIIHRKFISEIYIFYSRKAAKPLLNEIFNISKLLSNSIKSNLRVNYNPGLEHQCHDIESYTIILLTHFYT